MNTFETFSIGALAFHEAVIQPAFADIIPLGFPYTGTLNEFTLMDDVPYRRNIIDIRRVQNILQRRDASCDINYKKVVGATTRQITTEEVYGATRFCRSEFYKGCLKDWRDHDPLFGSKILPYFQQAVNVDIASNSYFGDIDRVVPATNVWSTNVYDGIFKWLKRYTVAQVIPSTYTFQIPDGTVYTGASGYLAAYQLLQQMYNAQNQLMYAFPDTEKAFYVSKEIKKGYENYLISVGDMKQYELIQEGIKMVTYMGIPIFEEPIWTPIITELKGAPGYAAILTIRGNFVFATDSQYGEGEDGHTALEVWYEKKDMQWYYRMFMKAGTQIALPEFTIYAISAWN